MGYTLFSTAKSWCAPGYGDCDPKKLADVVNRIREHFYNWYQTLELFMDAAECFRLQRFASDCQDDRCNEFYRGITLPRHMQQVEAMWLNNYPVKLRSEWREYQTGMTGECDCRLEKYDVPGRFSTAIDINRRYPKRLKVRAFDPADAGKRFAVRGTASTGQPVVEEFKLSTDVQESQWEFAAIDQEAGIIKELTAGRVALVDDDGKLLSIYEPDEEVPAYRRIKITGMDESCDVVNIRASRRYFKLYGDDEAVEIDSEVAFDAMARYLKLYQMSSKTSESLKQEKDYYATAFNMLTGAKSRERGKATQANVVIATPQFGGGRTLNRMGSTRRYL